MKIFGFVSLAYEGELVSVESDLRRTIPGFDIVGLPDGAVKEARERVRAALRNSGFEFPRERVLINLSPAGVKKEGASFDLPLALSILVKSGQIHSNGSSAPFMVLGELNLDGKVRPVPGILPAIVKAGQEGIEHAIVPYENRKEAESAGCCSVIAVRSLNETVVLLQKILRSPRDSRLVKNQVIRSSDRGDDLPSDEEPGEDIRDLKGQAVVKRAMEIAAAGRHNLFLFGPPGSGKTMALRRFPSIMPGLGREEALEVTKIYSIAGKLEHERGLITRPPFRMPHHSASLEGIIGGGKNMSPGEISFAHRGALFLDEAPEFSKSILQSLREPMEERKVSVVRASRNYWFPADFQLLMAANPCPCGNLGREDKICMCSIQEIESYWKRMGGPLLDRIDIRVPMEPVGGALLFADSSEGSGEIRGRVIRARSIQKLRFEGLSYHFNSVIPPGKILDFCVLSEDAQSGFRKVVEKFVLSSRACHSVLKIGRTIADLEGRERIEKDHIYEAVQYRRYGDGDYFWSERF